VKQFHNNGLILGAIALVVFVSQPAWAQTTQITAVEASVSNGELNLNLKTTAGKSLPIITSKNGKNSKTLFADIINAQLSLPGGGSFHQDNPAPGIASVDIRKLDAKTLRVTVIGTNDVPSNQPVVRNEDGITLSFISAENTANSTANNPAKPAGNTTSTADAADTSPQKPDVLVPNPKLTVDGKPALSVSPNQLFNRGNIAPPFIPRAVAPPVGDIAISNLDTSPTTIDLGTQERVPRLVLRDAPVREVLSLLARAAGLNLAYIGGEGPAAPSGNQQPGTPQISSTVSLDIENEAVQDVFNYVLRLSGLEANRSGRTIFVGAKLPNSTRDFVMRSLRLNQLTVGVAVNFLVALGAESAISRERLVTSVDAIPVGTTTAPVTQSQTTTETKLETQRIDYKDSVPLLRGLQALGDERTNSVTLIGSPRQVDMAAAQLIRLDLRRRQVVVNVKVIDVNLSGELTSNTSFSFGVGNNYFAVNNGQLTANFGGSAPASAANVTSSVTSTPTIANPLVNQTISTNPALGTDLYQLPKRLLAQLQTQLVNQNAKILTDPTLIVQEGQTASVALTQEVVANITNTTTSTGNTTTQTVTADKETVGLTVAVKIERIDDNGFVSLSVAPVIQAPQASASISVGENTQTISLVSTRSLNSGLIRLRDGQTLILSGIIQDQDQSSVTKIPILGDIPLLGALFRKTDKTHTRNEVVVLLTPQVMDDTENSAYGYNYTPTPEVRDILERKGLKLNK